MVTQHSMLYEFHHMNCWKKEYFSFFYLFIENACNPKRKHTFLCKMRYFIRAGNIWSRQLLRNFFQFSQFFICSLEYHQSFHVFWYVIGPYLSVNNGLYPFNQKPIFAVKLFCSFTCLFQPKQNLQCLILQTRM